MQSTSRFEATDPASSQLDADLLRRLAGYLQELGRPAHVPLSRWADEVRALYAGRHVNTRLRIYQAVREVVALAATDATTEAIGPELVERYKAVKAASQPSTINGLLASLRVAFKIAVERGWAGPEVIARCKWRVRDRGRGQKHFSRDEVHRVLEHLRARAGESWKDHRLYAR